MADKTYVAVFIKPKTRKKLKIRCVEEGKTFDQLLNELVEKK
jgi:hypothetical protein